MQVQNPLHLNRAVVDRSRVTNDEAERTMEEEEKIRLSTVSVRIMPSPNCKMNG